MNLIRDLEGNEYPLQATITYDKELNGNQSISFRVLPSKVNTFIHDITEMWEVVADTDYKIIYCKKRGEGDKLSVEIKAIPVFFDTFDTQRIYEEYNEHMTAQLCFNRIFQDSGYNVVLNGTFNAIQWEGFGAGDTRLTLFKNAINRYKAEFTVSGNTVTIENLIGRDTQFMYQYKLNASNIVQENDASAYWTYAKGYGDFAEGEWQDAKLIREYTSPIASIIGKREAPPIKNGNITTAETMDSQLKTLVDDSLKISVSADIHDLKKYPLAQPMVGDRAFLMDERIGLETEIRIQHLSITKDWKGNVLNLQAQFGSPNIVKQHQSNLQTAIGNITNLLEGKIKLPFSVLDNAVAEATKALQRMESQLSITENGSLMSVDSNDPNNVVVFNAAGLGVSDDGGATFKNAITGKGINASVIVTGALNTDYVLIGGGNANNYTEMNGGRIRSEGKFTREFGTGETAEYHAYTESWNGVYRSGLISKTANGQTLTDITRWTSLTDKGLTTQRAVHSGSSDYKGARFIDLFADETLTSGVFGQGMHVYSGQDLKVQANYRLTLESGEGWYTHLNGGGLQINTNGAGLVIKRNNAFSEDPATGGNYISLQAFDGVQHAMLGIGSNDYNLQLVSRFGAYVRLRSNTETQVMNADGDAFRPLRASTLIAQNSEVDLLFGRLYNVDGITYVQGQTDVYATRYKSSELVPVRASEFNVSGRGRIANVDNITYVQGDTEIRTTKYNSGVYVPITSSEFNTASSAFLKKNIEDYTENALEKIISTPVRNYYMNEDIEGIDPKRIGLIVQEAPLEIININGGESINLYAMTSLLWKAVQELTERLEVLEDGTTETTE